MQGDTRSHGLWERSAPPPPPTTTLVDSVEADVAVIGAGYTGLSAALHLRTLGADVVVLEGAEIGFGGSGRNVGLVNAGLWVRPETVVRALGSGFGPRLVAQLGSAPRLVFELIERHGIQCDAVQNGTLHCAVGEAGWREVSERARQWQALGAPVELLDAAATSNKVGSRAYRGALLDRRAGTIQPLAYARGLAAAAALAGARIFTRSPVQSIADEHGRWSLKTPAGRVKATWVIVATNAYSSGVWPQLRREVVALPYFNLATRPLPESQRTTILPERHGVWDTRQVLSSLRLDASGRLIFGSIGALRGNGLSIHRSWGHRALAKLFPALRGIDFEHEWHGRIGMTSDAIPRFHNLARNTISISGYNGRGIAPGTAFGRDLAHLAAGRITPADLSIPATPLTTPTFRTLREAGYEIGAQLVHLTAARF
jgi:glycine/D-amino acid oxidase-like deaminating enzyme